MLKRYCIGCSYFDNFYKIFKIFFPIRRGNNIFFNNTLNFKTISQLQSLFLFFI